MPDTSVSMHACISFSSAELRRTGLSSYRNKYGGESQHMGERDRSAPQTWPSRQVGGLPNNGLWGPMCLSPMWPSQVGSPWNPPEYFGRFWNIPDTSWTFRCSLDSPGPSWDCGTLPVSSPNNYLSIQTISTTSGHLMSAYSLLYKISK